MSATLRTALSDDVSRCGLGESGGGALIDQVQSSVLPQEPQKPQEKLSDRLELACQSNQQRL